MGSDKIIKRKYRLDSETKGTTGIRNLKALGCTVPSAARALLKGLRVSKSHSSHWLSYLEYGNGN